MVYFKGQGKYHTLITYELWHQFELISSFFFEFWVFWLLCLFATTWLDIAANTLTEIKIWYHEIKICQVSVKKIRCILQIHFFLQNKLPSKWHIITVKQNIYSPIRVMTRDTKIEDQTSLYEIWCYMSIITILISFNFHGFEVWTTSSWNRSEVYLEFVLR